MREEEQRRTSQPSDLDAPDLRLVLDRLHEGFQVVDRNFRYVYLNDAAVVHARREREALLGRSMIEAYPGIDRTPLFDFLRRCQATGERAELQNEFEYPDGQRALFELRVQPTGGGLAILSIDITERQQLQAQLRQAQKLEAIGRLASGVAHDFNNLLTVIGGFADLAKGELPAGAPAAAHLEEALRAVDRAAELTRKLLALAREAPSRPQGIDLNDLIAGLLQVLPRLVDESCEIATRLAPDLWPIEADPGGLEQLLLNLAVNARDAMPRGGRLRIETSNQTLAEPVRMRWGRPIAAGDYVLLAVTDSGTGIAPEHLERIFDPFFTTKPPGQGTGLGLSVCMGIAEQAGGYINVYSEPGQGTTFRVYLPRREAGASRPEIRPAGEPRAGDERIAVVEDDPQLRGLMVSVLGRAGYRVTEVEGGPAAAATLARLARLDLLVTDVVMPGVTGPALAELLRRERPRLPVLFVSGYPGSAIAERHLLAEGETLLEKPFGSERLLAAVRALLDG